MFVLVLTELRGWPRRRWLAFPAAAALLAGGYLAAVGVPVAYLRAAWFALALVAAGLGAAVLVSYLPATGWRPDVGCSPCAAVTSLTVLGSLVAVATYGPSLVGPGLGAALTLFGLVKRLGEPDRCS
ncbi:MAG: hypothetical protein ACXVYY_19965 [Oryzihumus sp.]